MDESCVVCAEPLEWCAFGPCNHKEVCSTCVTRLRLVMGDKRCCICKQDCPSVFITKNLGGFTNTISNFNTLHERVIKGNRLKNITSTPQPIHSHKPFRTNDLWYNDQIQAYFDDKDHFSAISSMCKLSCRICANQSGENSSSFSSSSSSSLKFDGLNALKRHLKIEHNLLMCELCLKEKKAFISEQKLYTHEQLQQHKRNGNSVMDGSKEERGGFKGHPFCDFCSRHFYGDNELYQHMNTEHYHCFICQADFPGENEYFRTYEHLEMHFRNDHCLCEHEDCLSKKFIVFKSDALLKRHNVQVHSGNMSRSERNRALQIPATQLFNFHTPRTGGEERGGRGGRGGRGRARGGERGGGGERQDAELSNHRSRRDSSYQSQSSADVDIAMQASLETIQIENALRESAISTSSRLSSSSASSSSASAYPPLSSAALEGNNRTTGLVQTYRPSPRLVPFNSYEILHTQDNFPSLTDNSPAMDASSLLHKNYSPSPSSSLQPSSFPPLPSSSSTSASDKTQAQKNTKNASMAALLGGKKDSNNQIRIIRPKKIMENAFSSASTSSPFSSIPSSFPPLSMSSTSSSSSPSPSSGIPPVSFPPLSMSSSVAPSSSNGFNPSERFNTVAMKKDKKKITSSPSPSPSSSKAVPSSSSFPPLSLLPLPSSSSFSSTSSTTADVLSEPELKAETKALAKEIRTRLGSESTLFDEFKSISGEFRHGTISTNEYFNHILRLGLVDLVPRLGRTCPDVEKRRELMKAYELNLIMEGKRKEKEKGKKKGVEREEEKGSDRLWEEMEYLKEKQLYRKGKERGKGEERVMDDSTFPNLFHRSGSNDSLHSSVSINHFHSSSSAPDLSSPSFQRLVSTKPDDSFGKWTCDICTLVNSPGLVRCEACGSVKTGNGKKKKGGKKERMIIGYGNLLHTPETNTNVGNVWSNR